MYKASIFGHHFLYSRVIWVNRVRLPILLVVSSTGKLSVLADASVVSTYICTGTVLLFIFVHIERTQGILSEMIFQERCTGSARSGGEAHLFGRRGRLMNEKWRLSGRVTSWRQKDRQNRSEGRR